MNDTYAAQEEKYFRWLHSSLDPGESLFLAPADNAEACVSVSTLEEAVAVAAEWRDRGAFTSTGSFPVGTTRKRENLLCVPAIVLDADLKDALIAEGVEEEEAERRIRTCPPAVLEKLCAKHVQTIIDALARVGLAPSAIIFTGGGHHIYILIDFLDQREVGRIIAVHKMLVAKLNALAGWELFDTQVVDSGTRYVRVPGTANCKSDPPRWAEIISNGGPTFGLGQLEALVGAQEEPRAASDEGTSNSDEAASGESQTSAPDNVVSLLLPYWKKTKRHDLALALSGYLAKAGWSWADVKACLVSLATRTHDEELRSRLTDLKTTFTKLAKGEDVAGYTKLAHTLTAADLKRLEEAVGSGELPVEDDTQEEAPVAPAPAVEKVAPFPLEVLPPKTRRLVEAGAKALPCPPDYIAVPLLTLAGAAIGTTCEIEVKRGWRERGNLYTDVIAPPGSKKSPALKLAATPITEQQAALGRKYKDAQAAHEKAKVRYEVELAAWKKDVAAKKAGAEDKPIEPPPPVLEQLVTTDATVEALATLLEANPRGVVYLSDELTGWARGFNQYKNGKGADRQAWLSFWSGAQVIVNRKVRREPLVLDAPFVAVTGCLPPDVLPDLSDERGREDGFVHRILPSFPDPLPGQWTEDEIDPQVLDGVREVFAYLYKLTPGEDGQGNPSPRVFRFSPAAKAAWQEWITSHYEEQEAETFLANLRGPWAKLEGICGRLVLIIHGLRLAEAETASTQIEEKDIAAARALVDYFKSHIRKVYAQLRSTAEDRRAEAAREWIERHGGRTSARDFLRWKVAGVKTGSEAKKFLKRLADRGWGKMEQVGRRELFILYTVDTFDTEAKPQ